MSDSLPRARAADSLPRARAAIRRIDQYRPPLGERVGLRLDFNENTRGASPKVLQALRELEPDCLARSPSVSRSSAVWLSSSAWAPTKCC